MRSGVTKGVVVQRRRRLHIRYQFRRYYESKAISHLHRRGNGRRSKKSQKPSSVLGFLPPVSVLSSSNSNSAMMPRRNRDERPLHWTPAMEDFLLERLYEYHDQNHGRHPESHDYNQWGVEMAKFFDGYVLDGDRIREKRRQLGKVYTAYKMLQNHTGVGWDPITKTFTCSEELRRNLCKRNREARTLFTQGWKLNELYLATVFPTRIGASGLGAYRPTVGQEGVDGVTYEDVAARDAQQQPDQNAPYQTSDDDKDRNDLGNRVKRFCQRNVTDVASTSRVIRKKQSRSRNLNDSSCEELLEMVRDMRDDLREGIRSSKESQPSSNTVDSPSEAEIILTSLKEMGIGPRMQVHAFDKIMHSDVWRSVWGKVDDGMRRAFLNDFVVVPKTPCIYDPPNPYNQVPNPYNQPSNPFG